MAYFEKKNLNLFIYQDCNYLSQKSNLELKIILTLKKNFKLLKINKILNNIGYNVSIKILKLKQLNLIQDL